MMAKLKIQKLPIELDGISGPEDARKVYDAVHGSMGYRVEMEGHPSMDLKSDSEKYGELEAFRQYCLLRGIGQQSPK